MGNSIEAAKALLEEMASNNYHFLSERATPSCRSGKYDVDVLTLLASQVNALAHRLDRVGVSSLPGNSSGSSVGVYAICETMVCRGIPLLNTIMVTLPLSMPMLCTILTPRHRAIPTPMLTVWNARAISTPLTRTRTPHHRMPCSYLCSSAEPPISHHHHLYNPNKTSRVSWSNS